MTKPQPSKVLRHFRLGMDTHEMSVVYGIHESCIYTLLGIARELERGDKDHPDAAPEREQAVEGEQERGLSVAKVQ